MLFFLFAFLAGVIMIFSPCIWPLLPIILSAGASGGKKKPLGIVTGLSISFLFVTLLLTAVLRVFPVDPEIFRTASVVVIIFLGLTLLIPKLTKVVEGFLSRISSSFGPVKTDSSGFGGGFLTGLALGLVWTPCAGPVLATVATVAATQGVSMVVFLTAVFFILGVSVPLFIIAFLGQRIFTKMRGANKYTARIQQVFGIIIVLTAVFIYTGYDKVLQTKILEGRGEGSSWIGSFEKSTFLEDKLKSIRMPKQDGAAVSDQENLGQAPEFTDIEAWLNTEGGKALRMEDLRGKVVLIDFWTYSCINCIRTLPYVTAWYEKYKDQDFVVVGVHTPEFAFEKKKSNVEEAIKKYSITYPVAQDNNYGTWTAYQNQYWPAHYLIDKDGIIRYTHFGEGKYDVTEKMIQNLIRETGKKVVSEVTSVTAEARGTGGQTPETYLGLSRLERFESTPNPTNFGVQNFTLPITLKADSWGYGGRFNIEAERSVALPGSLLRFQTKAKKVFLVMGPTEGEGLVEVLLDGKPLPSALAGKDVKNSQVNVTEERLYELVDGTNFEEHTLELRFPNGNVALYAFTFS